MSIEVSQVSKRYRSFAALDDVSLAIPSGELVALLGPSGCGKTTLLRIIAGLEVPDAGSVLFNGSDATGVHARDRNVGFVFQHYALFRHMSVFENVAFGLRVKPRAGRPSASVIRERVNELLELVQLDRLAHRYPDQLSGGQRQRVALARALAVRPAVLLLDEPFGALDAKVRKELRRWIRRLHEEIHVTSVFVTHDQEEALEVADRVVVMNRGRVEQVGSPDEVYEHPATPFVFQFLGDVNLFHARVESGRAIVGDAEFRLDRRDVRDGAARIYIRPHEMEILTRVNGKDGIRALIREVRPMGPMVRVSLARCADGEAMEAQLPRDRADGSLAPGNVVYVRPRNLRVFDSGRPPD